MKDRIIIEQKPELEYLKETMPKEDIAEVDGLCPKRQREILGCRSIVYRALGKKRLLHDSFGAPILEQGNLHISISHSSTMLAVALSPSPCGIDIEDKNRNFSRIITKYLSHREIELLQKITDGFAIAWCTKEALYKYQRTLKLNYINDIHIDGIEESNRLLHCSILDKRDILARYDYYGNCISAVIFER